MTNVSASSALKLKVFVSLLVVAALVASRLSPNAVQEASFLRGFQDSANSQLRKLQASPVAIPVAIPVGRFDNLPNPALGISDGFGPFASKVDPIPAAAAKKVSTARTTGVVTSSTPKGVQGITGLPVNKNIAVNQNIPGLKASIPGLPVTKVIPTFTALPKFTPLPSNFTKVPAITPIPARKFRDFPGLP